MIYGVGYVCEDGWQSRWSQYLEYHHLIPALVSGDEINRVVGRVIRGCEDSCVPDVGYLFNGVLVRHTPFPAREKDAGILTFQSNSRESLESLAGAFNLPLPEALIRRK